MELKYLDNLFVDLIVIFKIQQNNFFVKNYLLKICWISLYYPTLMFNLVYNGTYNTSGIDSKYIY